MIKLLSLGFGSLAGLAALSALAMVDAIVAVAGPVQSADHVSYVLFASNSDSISMSGSTDDIRRARALRNGDEALLYFRQGSAAYVIRDPATLRQAKAIFKPQEDLGTRQGELGPRGSLARSRVSSAPSRVGSVRCKRTLPGDRQPSSVVNRASLAAGRASLARSKESWAGSR